MDIGVWRKSGRRTIHLGRFYDHKEMLEGEPFKNDSPAENGWPKKPKWKVLWKNLFKQSRKMFDPAVHEKAAYNSETYMQNFDQGQSGQTTDEHLIDFLPRSFTARYADPSRLLS